METLTQQQLAERAREAVESSELTQREVADLLSVKQPSVAQALQPNYPGLDGLRKRILKELEGVEVEEGFLVKS